MALPGRPTLHQLLRLSLPEPVRWLTPAPTPELQIAWVVTTLQAARPGDLLLLPGNALEAGGWEEIAARGVAAVLLLAAPASELPEDFPVPVGVMEASQDVRLIEQELVSMLVSQRAALMERGVRIHAQLAHLAAEGEGLEGLARAIAEISGRGVLIQDKRLTILAQVPSSTLAAIWEEIVAPLYNLAALPEILRDRKQASQQGGGLEQTIPGGLERLVATITVGEIARGYLSLIGLEGEFDALDHLVIEQGVLVCAVEMARAKAVREAEKRLKGDLLTALLQEDLAPRDARLWVQAMGLDLDQAHVALRFAWDATTAPSRRRLETLISGEVSRQNLKVIVNPMGMEMVCFCQIPSGGRIDPAIALARAVMAQADQEYPGTPLRCGIGIPANNLGSWRASFRQAGQALEIARRFAETQPMLFADLSVYRLLLQLEHSPELSAFLEEILGPILAHESADEFLRTLQTYFDHNGNLSQAAEALYIHRNTLLYRMERIASIANLDLDNPEARLAAQLALYIQRMIAPGRG